jgi:hypothetical protein
VLAVEEKKKYINTLLSKPCSARSKCQNEKFENGISDLKILKLKNFRKTNGKHKKKSESIDFQYFSKIYGFPKNIFTFFVKRACPR